jgi:hypothetical protein
VENQQVTAVDEADCDMLTTTVSDEALEAAAGVAKRAYPTSPIPATTISCC